MSTELTERKKKLRDEFIDARGYWNAFWDGLLELDEDFFEAYTAFLERPLAQRPARAEGQGVRLHRSRRGSDPSVRAGHPPAHQAGARLRRDGAGDHGGPRADGDARYPRLQHRRPDPLRGARGRGAAGAPGDVGATTRAQGRLRGQARLLAPVLGPRCYSSTRTSSRRTRRFSSVPWVSGVLEPKIKELIYTAFDVSATHLYTSGLRLHIKNAIGYGATREEILEVIELASVIGIHSCTEGVPILLEELAAAGEEASP